MIDRLHIPRMFSQKCYLSERPYFNKVIIMTFEEENAPILIPGAVKR